MKAGRLVVLGAVNVDLVVRGARLPAPGETVVGGVFERHHGGKGANQAVAAARALRGTSLEGAVCFLGAVGDDAFGVQALEALAAERVDVSRARVVEGTPTGVALIVVDDAGENQIVVAPGANGRLGSDDAAAAVDDLDVSSLLLASLEVPLASVTEAAERCRQRGIRVVLNPAPATPDAAALLGAVSVVTPNEGELRAIAAGSTVASLVASHPGLAVVLTRGAGGAEVVDGDAGLVIHADRVEAVDTTGAGDCVNGVLAAGLFEGRSLAEAARRAVVAAGLSVAVPGAREGMPFREAIDQALK